MYTSHLGAAAPTSLPGFAPYTAEESWLCYLHAAPSRVKPFLHRCKYNCIILSYFPLYNQHWTPSLRLSSCNQSNCIRAASFHWPQWLYRQFVCAVCTPLIKGKTKHTHTHTAHTFPFDSVGNTMNVACDPVTYCTDIAIINHMKEPQRQARTPQTYLAISDHTAIQLPLPPASAA